MVNVGKLDRYVTIQQATWTHSTDTNDRYPSTWTTYKTCWASRVQKQSQELSEGEQFVLLDTFTYKIRYYDAPAITGRMRISDDSTIYDIVSIKELGRKEAWLIMAQKRDNV